MDSGIRTGEEMILFWVIVYFASIVIAGRIYWQKEKSSRGFLAGAFLGPLGIILVYLFPQLLSNPLVTNRIGRVYNKNLEENDLIAFSQLYDDPARLSEIKKRKVGAGFEVSKAYMPITDGFFISMLLGLMIFSFPVLFSLWRGKDQFTFFIFMQNGLALIIFLIPFIMCLANYQTTIICPRCGQIHHLVSNFEEFLGKTRDCDPRKKGCLTCDYLPSRDREITIE